MFMFCRNAFLSASKRFVEKDLEVSMAGRAFMITGANSGIGKATAMAIAKKGTSTTACFSANQLIYESVLWLVLMHSYNPSTLQKGQVTVGLSVQYLH